MQPRLKIIIDFDGTLTAEEQQAAELAELSISTLAHEILHVSVEQVQADYAATKSRVLTQPHLYSWEVNGLATSYADEGAFILNTVALQTMLHDGGAYEQAVGEHFNEVEYGPVTDCVNYLFHRHTAEIKPLFRPAARQVLSSLQEHPLRTPIILTNSLGDKVIRHLKTLKLSTDIEVLGDTRQYDMDPLWTHHFDQPDIGEPPVWQVDGLHRIDLRRPIYHRALLQAALDGSQLAVVADTFSLPGAMPMVMSIPFLLLRTPYTPDWCAEAVTAHPYGHLLEDLSQLPQALGVLH